MSLTSDTIPQVTLADGTRLPALGLGTWKMGERARNAAREVAALKHGLDLGMTVVDTAEMYGEGGAEEIVAQAMAGRRAAAFVVSKVYPQNAGATSMKDACERSLRRLRVDCIDLYLLHWRGRIPARGKRGRVRTPACGRQDPALGRVEFRHVGHGRAACASGRRHCAINQVLYNLCKRSIEWRLLDWCRTRRIPVMAYSPVAQGALSTNRKLVTIARTLAITPAQLALAWVLTRPQVIAIPQSSNIAHIDANRASVAIQLDKGVLAALDAAFAPPRTATRLSVI